jgi:hypothetical protein
MKLSPRLFLLALLLCTPTAACAKVPGQAARTKTVALPTSTEPAVQFGVFEGTGRACSGLLKITPKRLSWNTAFSPCPASAHTLVERRQESNATQWAYRFVHTPKNCFYKVVMLKKLVDVDGRVEWHASGFTSMKAYKADAKVDRLNCPLVKLD